MTSRARLLAVPLALSLGVAGCSTSSPAPTGRPTTGTTAGQSTAAVTAAPTFSPTGRDPDAAQRQRFASAARLVAAAPGSLGILVRDRQTGVTWQAGATDRPIWTASTIKLALVTSLLERARAGTVSLDSVARQQIADILDFSSDGAATALWNRYGKDSQVPRFQQTYAMTGLRFVPGFPRIWGHMKCTAADLLRLISYVLDRLNPTDRALIVDGMRHVGPIQQWGIFAAGPALRPGTKDGWSIEPDDGGRHWVTNAVGFTGPDQRYAVAVMYQLLPGQGIDVGVHAVSDLIATVFGAPVPARVTVPDPSTGL